MLYAVLRDQKKTREQDAPDQYAEKRQVAEGVVVKDNELQKFREEAKKYGVLYCVLKDNKTEGYLTDIMIWAEGAGKIIRI